MIWRRSSVRRPALTAILAVLGSLLVAPTAVSAPSQTPPPSGDRKIDPALQRGLDARGAADFVVTFGAWADLAGASSSGDWAGRGRAVLNALDRTAADSQREVRARLDKAGVKYRSFSVANAIYVFGGSEALAGQLAAEAEVQRLDPARTFALPKPARSKQKAALDEDVEWGVAEIGADRVWTDFADRGEGIVVANVDSGVQFDHPALAASYRGKQPDGSVQHDYSWYDPSAVCPAGLGPCDNAGHGTHTMGTIVGDAGAGNRIGVAPGARWIATKGCEGEGCSSFALLASAQWILAPTDQQGHNPRPDLRPQIVNNSWGAPTGPAEDPWYDAAIDAWIGAGIFPAFSNGNDGPGCDTSGTPGDSLAAYSVGAYAADGSIAGFSSRGPGAEGDVKPNLAAPGVAVRSALPGNTYDAWDGTSMASPHLAGTVALMWAAAPALAGDIEATEALLDETARDVDATECGGTVADNNVFGEGKLDAYAAVQASPRGPSGTLRGTVRSATGDPVGNATVTLTGTANRRLTTAPDGTFSALLSAGDYTATASRFGYADATERVTVAADGEAVRDFTLRLLPRVTVSGTVTEGSAHGWPLYATVTVDGVPDGTFRTDPQTGRYSFELPAGASYTLRVAAEYPGMTAKAVPVEVGSSDVVQDVALVADPYSCTAPGYRAAAPRITYQQSFDEPATPAGWTVTDPLGNGQVWRFDDDWGFGNRTGGEGFYGWVFSAGYGEDAEQDTAMVSPPIDLSDTATPAVWFSTDYSDGPSSTADVDVSLDGGSTWTTVWRRTNPSVFESREQVPIPQAAGHSGVRVRFHYTASFDTWWQVDDVAVGERVCDTVPGGLMLGQVRDANNQAPLVGATVRSTTVADVTTKTVATPADAALDDGFYWMFVPGNGSYAASQPRYQTHTRTVSAARDRVTRADFAPTAGVIEVSTASVSGSVALGGRTTTKLTLRNDGTATARVDLAERHGDVSSLSLAAAPLRRVAATVSPRAKPSGAARQAAVPASATGGPWAPLADYPIAIMDNTVAYSGGELYSVGGRTGAGATAQSYRYDPETAAWSRIADLPRARQKPAAGFLNGRLYVAGGWTATGDARADMDVYDPHTGTWSAGPSMPGQAAAAGMAVLGDQLFVVGGCISECGRQEVFRYDASARAWQRLADYPRDTAWLACGGIDGSVYCAGGTAGGGSSARTYRYDEATNTWTRLADMPADLWGSGSTVSGGRLLVSGGVVQGRFVTNEGYSYDPAANAWTALPNGQHSYYRGGSACGFAKIGGTPGDFVTSPLSEILPGYTDCGDADPVSWLRAAPTGVTLAPNTQAEVTVTLDAGALDQPGTYTAALQARDNTPYTPLSVTVSLQVAPPQSWGQLSGTVTGRGCDGTVKPLPGATIRLDGALADHTLRSDAAGAYRLWLDRRNSPVRITVVADGWFPATGEATVRAGQTTVKDLTLSRTGCTTTSGGTR